jgi:hypothetical protein
MPFTSRRSIPVKIAGSSLETRMQLTFRRAIFFSLGTEP